MALLPRAVIRRRRLISSSTLSACPFRASHRWCRARRSELARREPSIIRNPLLDALAFLGLVAASVAGLLTAANARLVAPELDGSARASLVALAMAGTLVVYGVDRLRDVRRDRASWPDRAAFIETNTRWLQAIVIGAAGVAFASALQQPPTVWIVCIAIAGLGLAHRRLKGRHAGFKLAYLTAAWWGVTVGLPWVRGGASTPLPILASVGLASGFALAANMFASNPAITGAAKPGQRRWQAVWLAAAGIGCALLGPDEAIAVAWIPAAQLAAVLATLASGRRPGERERLWLVDGSLALGAMASLITLG